ncbi:hypothetical protein EDC04DRAFT_775918 [Pisolithus marmoratus]|nr:hypothetical protein EDC04DRAFT_775918 [Pisolithus marmoratus]
MARCETISAYNKYVIIIVQIIGGIVMIIRVYALYMKSKRWAILSPLPATTRPVPTPPLRHGCNVPTTYEAAERIAIAWSGQMTFDAVVFVLTLWRTLHIPRLGSRSLLDVFIRDGVLYFGLMTCVNAANITIFLVCNTSPTKSLIAGFTNAISSTMVSRLMLNLRDPKISMSSQPVTPIALANWRRNPMFELRTLKEYRRKKTDNTYVAEG